MLTSYVSIELSQSCAAHIDPLSSCLFMSELVLCSQFLLQIVVHGSGAFHAKVNHYPLLELIMVISLSGPQWTLKICGPISVITVCLPKCLSPDYLNETTPSFSLNVRVPISPSQESEL